MTPFATFIGRVFGLNPKVRPYLLEARASGFTIGFTITLAVFMDIFLYGVIVPIAPFALAERMGVPEDRVQKDVSISVLVYAAGLLAGSPVFGYLCDTYHNRRLFMMIGLVALAGATLILCLTRCLWLFIVGRLVQGVSAASVWTVGLALVSDSFSEEHIGKMMGIIGTGMSLGTFLGPFLGGIVYDRAGYYAVFGVCFGIIAVDIFLRFFMLEKKDLYRFQSESAVADNESNVDESNVADRVTDKDASDQSTSAPQSKVPAVIRLLGNKRMLNGLFLTIIIGWVLTGLETTLPLRAEDIFDFSSLGTGMLFLPIAITSFLGPLAGWWTDRCGARWPLATGFFFSTPFLIILRLPEDNRTSQIVLMFALLSLLGLSASLLIPSVMAEISVIVFDAEAKQPGIFGKHSAYGQAFALFNLAYSAGSVFGPLEAGFVADADGFGTMAWSLGIISFVASVLAILFTGGYLFNRKGDDNVTQQQQQQQQEESEIAVVAEEEKGVSV
ncbi:MFS transporter-like protein [Myxozyma melibiosi]|uniref:MFS transporter-like protein n=1 Tax=Myxozyma melibiosi TaxID=54550 RepID=A0ABR1F756_9ASCO